MSTPLLGQFLIAVSGFIDARNETQLADYLTLEPPFGDHYVRMIAELRRTYPKGGDDALEEKCSKHLTAAREGADGATWTPFIKYMVQYLAYLRDVDSDPSRYLETYELLSELQQRANSALSHATLGHMMLPAVVTNARLVCRLAIGLDKQPQLIAHLKSAQSGGDDGGAKETLPERAANILRQPLVTCLNDRSAALKDGKPEGRQRGIYTIANLCLKILFQCRKTRSATQIFENIDNLSPPLSAYPKRDRVTYLYYLGRFLFQNNHFYRAHLALQQAYSESPAHPSCTRQRHHILIFLLTSNLILGRLPSAPLLATSEAQPLTHHFRPLFTALTTGDLTLLRSHLDPTTSPSAPFFLHHRILFQLSNRLEPLCWRTLVRKTWIVAGTAPADPTSKVAPIVAIPDLMAAFRWLETRFAPLADYVDPDFQGLGWQPDDVSHFLNATTVESKLASLIDQGLLNGFISHRQMKFAILGAGRKGGALKAGFPSPWRVLSERAEREGQGAVPGWKVEGRGGDGFEEGGVLRLTGVKEVGS